MDWFTKSLIAVFCLIPIFFAIPFYHAHYNVRPETAVVFWFIGTIVGVAGWLSLSGNGSALAVTVPALSIVAMGLVFGSIAYIMLFQAVVEAPNPGLPAAMVNVNAVIAYLMTPLLVITLPKYFGAMNFARFDKVDFATLVVIIACVCTIGLRR